MLDLLMKRRSIRKYKDKKIEKEKIDQLVQGVLTSPSGRNSRPLEFVLVDDKEILGKLGEIRGQASGPIGRSSMAIAILADSSLTDTWIEDASIAATIIQLNAQDLGLGSCWIQVKGRTSPGGGEVEAMVRSILSIPDDYRVLSIISLGYPDELKKHHNKEDLDYSKIHKNSF